MAFPNQRRVKHAGSLTTAAGRDERALHDCLCLEVMPSSWVWAYRRLLDPCADPSDLPIRIA